MPVAREIDALYFIKKNETFFRDPIDNQEQFANFYEEQNKTDLILDYSKKFTSVLTETFHKEARAIDWWFNGDFEEVLKEEKIRQFIMDNQKHPALIAWQKKHPPKEISAPRSLSEKEISAPPSLSEKEIEAFQRLSDELKQLLAPAQKQIGQYIKELKGLKSNLQTKNDILCLNNTQNDINSSVDTLSSIQGELLDKTRPLIHSEIQKKFEDIENKLTNSIRTNLLQVEDKPIKSWGEQFLNTILKFFGFDGYKSQATKQTDKRNIIVGDLCKQLPQVSNKINDFKEELKKSKEEEKGSIPNPDHVEMSL